MKYSGDYIRAHFTKYITKYMDAVRMVSEEFLWGKDLTIKDYLLHISQPGNRSDELSIYLVSRFIQKYIAVLIEDSVWFTGKNTSIADCHIVLVYCLGWGGTYHDPNLKVLNLVGQWEYQGHQHQDKNLTVVLCMNQNHHWGPQCHTCTPGLWVLHLQQMTQMSLWMSLWTNQNGNDINANENPEFSRKNSTKSIRVPIQTRSSAIVP